MWRAHHDGSSTRSIQKVTAIFVKLCVMELELWPFMVCQNTDFKTLQDIKVLLKVSSHGILKKMLETAWEKAHAKDETTYCNRKQRVIGECQLQNVKNIYLESFRNTRKHHDFVTQACREASRTVAFWSILVHQITKVTLQCPSSGHAWDWQAPAAALAQQQLPNTTQSPFRISCHISCHNGYGSVHNVHTGTQLSNCHNGRLFTNLHPSEYLNVCSTGVTHLQNSKIRPTRHVPKLFVQPFAWPSRDMNKWTTADPAKCIKTAVKSVLHQCSIIVINLQYLYVFMTFAYFYYILL